MKLYNSLSGVKETLEKPTGRPLHFFVCGPTVYDYPHIGHARTYASFDTFVRFLRSQKWKITYLQNITDIDDKIIDRAKSKNEDPLRYAHKFEAIYKSDMQSIACSSVTKYARATDHIKNIIRQIQRLIENGNAYLIEGEGYYFDITSFPDYGKLSRRTALQAEDAITRIDEQIRKKNKGDFALWKSVAVPEKDSKKKFTIINGEPAWNTKIGWGRPGWHIEDTAITEHFFGPQYDIHGGGSDLKFPHHEAEIAQQESASGKKPFVRIWMHTGSLRINGQKMSKSLGNFFTIREFLNKETSNTLRMIIAMHHYRSPIQWSEDSVLQAKQINDLIFSTSDALTLNQKKSIQETPAIKKQWQETIDEFTSEFTSAMEDDLNTPEAIAAVFKFATTLRSIAWKISKTHAKKAQGLLEKTVEILGITLSEYKIPSSIAKLVAERELYRGNKQFTHADTLRNQVDALGYTIEDTPIGPFPRKKIS